MGRIVRRVADKSLDAIHHADRALSGDRSYWYVATPYSRYADGLEAACAAACRVTAALIRERLPVFSPIAHSHSISLIGDLDPLSHEIWLAADAPLMAAAHGLIVVELPGWDESVGIAHEIEAFEAEGKPVVHLDPEEIA